MVKYMGNEQTELMNLRFCCTEEYVVFLGKKKTEQKKSSLRKISNEGRITTENKKANKIFRTDKEICHIHHNFIIRVEH
uniref:Uncharacterized protein n=1 Tax=Arion vulgaris TaxID=1028688 RepID=A0A0B7B005_9EUPU